MTGAVAFLGLIAVLDNFIFVETDPDLEEMVLVEVTASEAETPSEADDESSPDPFWIDRHEVSHADFAEFVVATGYQAHIEVLHAEWLTARASVDLPQSQGGDAGGTQKLPMTTSSDNSVVQVSFEDAHAYCSWLGKSLPSDLQVQFAARDGRDVDGLAGEPQPFNHDRTKSNVWMSIEHKKDAVIEGDTGAELLGFLCVKNVDSD